MLLFLIKLTLTPLLMGGVTYASRRWGASFGALLAGLPITSAPISVYLAIEEGARFAATAALASLAGVGAVTFSYLAYVEVSRRRAPFLSMSAALFAYALAMAAALVLKPPLAAILIADGILVAAVFARGRASDLSTASAVPPRWDLPARLVASTALVFAVTLAARAIGPAYSGLFSTIPVIAWPLIVFAHAQDGRARAVVVVLGVLRGTLGVIAFYLIVYAMLPSHTITGTAATALCVAALITFAWFRLGQPGAPQLSGSGTRSGGGTADTG